MSDQPKPATGETEKLADWILNRLPATGGDVEFTRLELETRINAALSTNDQPKPAILKCPYCGCKALHADALTMCCNQAIRNALASKPKTTGEQVSGRIWPKGHEKPTPVKPKPAGEWTAIVVKNEPFTGCRISLGGKIITGNLFPADAENLAKAINAALAAAEEKYENATDNLYRDIKRLNQQLAAAWRKGHAEAQAPALERIDELHKQLAAEREARQLAEHNMTNWHQAAMRDAAALAKVKEGTSGG